ncbi:MAG: DUF2061 domain-containing protein [Brumimicrobium sp.]
MHKRHIAKTLTWRVVGTLDTIMLGWLLTGNMDTGLQIGGAELVTKLLLYYFHERAWYNLKIFKKGSSKARHLIKTFTWRFIGTVDTIILSWFISGSAEIGMSIGGLELVTKMALYYLHERTWYKIKFGIKDKSPELAAEKTADEKS